MPRSTLLPPTVLLLVLSCLAETAPGASMRTSVFGSGGTPASLGARRSVGTFAQSTPIGVASAGNSVLYAGFWKAYLQMLQPADVATPNPELRDALLHNTPNPFRAATTVAFVLAKDGPVSAVVFDLAGARVRAVVDARLAAGVHRVEWDGTDGEGRPVPSGIYFLRYTTDSCQFVRKIMLLR